MAATNLAPSGGFEIVQNASSSDADELLRRARTGDRFALGQLLEPYRSYLALLARQQTVGRLHGKVDDSDVIQETFLDAFRDFRQFRGSTEAELAAWLRRILAHNLAGRFQHFGRQRRDLRLERDLAAALDASSQALEQRLVDPGGSPSQIAQHRDQAVMLANSLDRLPSHYRLVLVLRHLDELTFPEIAHRMERSEASVKKLWVRGLAQLRRIVREG
jgi:RNA polymerase sigma-70 factor (ECF subfamily)